MKNVKQKILATLVATAMLIPTTFAYAESTGSTGSKLMNSINKQQQRIETIKQKQEFKSVITEKKNLTKQNHETISTLRKEIQEKKATVKNLHKNIIENKKTLTPENLEKVEAQLQVIETQLSTLEATRDAIKTEFEESKTDLKNKAFEAASAHLDTIISIQNKRIEGLKQLNSEMDTLINTLQAALSSSTAGIS